MAQINALIFTAASPPASTIRLMGTTFTTGQPMRARIGVHPDDLPRVNGLVLYRLYTARAEYLYIGMGDLAGRIADHRTKPWFARVDSVTWDHYPSRARKRLFQDELYAIVLNQPRYNCDRDKRHQCHRHLPARVADHGDRVPRRQCRRCGRWWLHDGVLWQPFPDPRR